MANAIAEPNEEGAPIERTSSEPHHPNGPQRLVEFLKETRQEMSKVVTPSREEVQNNTLIVVGTVFFFAAFFWGIDMSLGRGLDWLLLKMTGH